MPSARRQPVKALFVLLGVAVSAVFAYVAVKDAQFGEAWAATREADALWLVPALAMMVAAFYIRVLRWRAMFEPDPRPPVGPLATALYLGYLFNNLLPLRAGEPIRIVALSRTTRASLSETAATVVTERVYDLLSVLVLLFVTLPWLPDLVWVDAAGILAAAVAFAIVAAVVALARFGVRPIAFVTRQLARLPGVPAERLQDSAANTLRGLAGLRRARAALVAFGWTTLSWAVLAVGFWLVTVAFDFSLSPLAGLLIVITVGLAMILPSSPAAVGVFEGATVVVLTAYGVEDSAALSCALVLHALNTLPFYVLAPLILRRQAPLIRGGRADAPTLAGEVVPGAPRR